MWGPGGRNYEKLIKRSPHKENNQSFGNPYLRQHGKPLLSRQKKHQHFRVPVRSAATLLYFNGFLGHIYYKKNPVDDVKDGQTMHRSWKT
jgi:hypothetical protein